MRPSLILILACIAVAVLGPLAVEGRAAANVIALLHVQNAAGDSEATSTLDRTLRFELSRFGSLAGPERTRDALRRLRIRSADQAVPALLQLLGEELAADWLIAASLHDTERRAIPRCTMSLRIYSTATGELMWTGFQGGSGIDRRKVLGLGTTEEMDELIPLVVRDLLEELPTNGGVSSGIDTKESKRYRSGLGKVAIIPFSGSTRKRPTLNAETVTEAVRSQLFSSGVDLVSPNLSYEVLRQQQSGRRIGVTAESRMTLHTDAGADTILTGEVEAYELGGSEFEPRPRVAIAMRLLEADTGRILWAGELERSGWDGQSLLGLGRVPSRGALTERITEILTRRLEKEYLEKDSG